MSRNRQHRNHNQKQARANRANAQLSTGPVTLEGKAVSSQNAIRHGLTSKQIVLPGEDAAAFDIQREKLHQEFRPITETEVTLVDEIAACAWRLARARSVETAALAELIKSHPNTALTVAEALAGILIDNPKEITKIQRYVTTFERSYYRALNKLTSMRKDEAKQRAATSDSPVRTATMTPEDVDGFVSQNAVTNEDIDEAIQQIQEEIRCYQAYADSQNLQPSEE